MSTDSLLRLLNAFESLRGLVLGDVMLDRFVYGSMRRISPEAPIPVMSIERHADMPGGAGNVVRNLAALGACSTIVGVVGNDTWASSLGAQFAMIPDVKAALVFDSARQTTVKTRYVGDGQQVLRADRETLTALSTDAEERLLAAYEQALADADFVILSDYGKGVLSDAVAGAAIEMARLAGKYVIVDPKSKTFGKYRGASVVRPNRNELELACGFACDSDEQIEAGARQILAEGDCDMLVVTRGKDGMSIVSSGDLAVHLRTTASDAFGVSGADDTVAATLALALAAGGSIHEACALANLAAGIVAGKSGTAVVTTNEIIAALPPCRTAAMNTSSILLAAS